MPHPYTQAEIDAMTNAPHFGTCANCRPVDANAPTDAEKLARFECKFCRRSGMFWAGWHDDGIAMPCDGCGGDTIKAILGRGMSAPELPPYDGVNEVLCMNCRIQEHADHCRGVDDNGDLIPCAHGWPEGS